MVYFIGTAAPASAEACTLFKTMSRTPITMSFTAAQSGQRLYGFGCWVNTKDQQGPWSEMFVCVIP